MKYFFYALSFVATFISCNDSTNTVNNTSNNQPVASTAAPGSNNTPINEAPKSEEKPKLTWSQLYPILRRNLMESTCEPCVIAEENGNSITVNSRESDLMLSYWEFNSNTLKVSDIDSDGLLDYTIELLNEGGGCGGQIGFYERWTLFGSAPSNFKNTHVTTMESDNKSWTKVH
jgi:hypothetical protein